MSHPIEFDLQLNRNKSGNTIVVNSYYENDEIILDPSVVEFLEGKNLNDYYFVMTEESWEIVKRPESVPFGCIAPLPQMIFGGTLVKDGKKVTCYL